MLIIRTIVLAALVSFTSLSFAQLSDAGKQEALKVQRKIKEAKEQVKKVTTGGIAEELKNIPVKKKFTDEELRRIAEVQKRFGADSEATITRDGWLLVPFGETPTINCGINGFCIVALEPGEIATNVKVTDQTVWEVSTGSYGPSNLIQTIILKPRVSDSYSQLLIFTDKGRLYNAFVTSKPVAYREDGTVPIHSMSVRYIYPRDSSIDYDRIVGLQESALDELVGGHTFSGGDDGGESKSAAKDFETAFKLRYVGGKRGDRKADWKPVRVYADNNSRTTYVELPKNYSTMPAVFVKGPDGKNRVVNAKLSGANDNLIVIDGIHDRVVMKVIEAGIKAKYVTAFEAVRL